MGWVVGVEPTIFGTTIRRVNQLRHTHHKSKMPDFGNPAAANLSCVSLVRHEGFEPSTYRLEGGCSIQLS